MRYRWGGVVEELIRKTGWFAEFPQSHENLDFSHLPKTLPPPAAAISQSLLPFRIAKPQKPKP